MKSLSKLVMAALAAGLGWFLLQQMQSGGLAGIKLLGLGAGTTQTAAPPTRGNDTIRVASFNIQVFGEAKLNDPAVMPVIVEILKQFDLVAIQEVRAVSQDILPQLVELLNADGKFRYDYAIGPRLGRSNSKEQYAFVFDTATIEIDRYKLYTVDDPDDLLHREPLVGWFRARGPSAEQAFTFSLANVHTDPDEVERELSVLDDVFFRIREDPQRSEDDVILVGDFNAKGSRLGQLGTIRGLVRVVSGETPTNTAQNAQYDNILFDQTPTTEFTGRGGVFDFLRQYNLTQAQAEKISDHMPVWAEFSVIEGGRALPVASRPGSPAGY